MAAQTIRLDKHQWTLGERVGAGGLGAVFAATTPDVQRPAVVKLVEKLPGAQRELLFAQVDAARNIVPVLDVGEDETHYGLAMARAERSLRQVLVAQQQLDERSALVVLSDIAAALADLDGRLVHRDLKPENVLELDGRWCLADFGIARFSEATTANDTRKGWLTGGYAAPEQWRWERVTAATDVYALGVMAYEMLSGHLPFPGPDFRAEHLQAAPPTLTDINDRLAALVVQCLNKDPGSRPSAADTLQRLQAVLGPAARPGLASLQQADHDAVQRQAEAQRQQSVIENWVERRGRLYEDARRSLEGISDELAAVMRAAASQIIDRPRPGQLVGLGFGNAELTITQPRQTGGAPTEFGMPFVVIAFAEMTLLAPGRHGYRGRAHSLWYADVEEEDRFAWYELAFMTSALLRQLPDVAPYACTPSDGSVAIRPGVGTVQLAWTPTKLVPGELGEFLDRWGQWLSNAYSGRWGFPNQLPEATVLHNWRS